MNDYPIYPSGDHNGAAPAFFHNTAVIGANHICTCEDWDGQEGTTATRTSARLLRGRVRQGERGESADSLPRASRA